MAQFAGIYNAAAHIKWLKIQQNVNLTLDAETLLRNRDGNPVVVFSGANDAMYPYTLVCEGVNYGIPKGAVTRYKKVGTYNYEADIFAPEWLSVFNGAAVYMEDCSYAKNGVIWDEEKQRYYDGIYEHAIIRK